MMWPSHLHSHNATLLYIVSTGNCLKINRDPVMRPCSRLHFQLNKRCQRTYGSESCVRMSGQSSFAGNLTEELARTGAICWATS